MIPYILIIAGILLVLFGAMGLLSLVILPYRRLKKVVYDWEDDVLKFKTGQGRHEYKRSVGQLALIYLSALVAGIMLFFFGFYLGHAAKGDSFWFYKQVFGEDEKEDYWDKITEDNRYIASDGNTYTYYLQVSGDRYGFCGEECGSIDELRKKLSDIRRENTVVLIDSFAVSSAYHEAENALKDLGIKYETEEE